VPLDFLVLWIITFIALCVSFRYNILMQINKKLLVSFCSILFAVALLFVLNPINANAQTSTQISNGRICDAVSPDTGCSLNKTLTRGTVYFVIGTLEALTVGNPGINGQSVILQFENSPGSWTNVGLGDSNTGPNGRIEFSWSPNSIQQSGKYRLRYNGQSGVYNSSTSFPFTVTLIDAPSPPVLSPIPPVLLDFGQVDVGDTGFRSVFITNTGGSTLTGEVSGINVPFSCSFSPCTYTIPPNGSQEIEIEFTPTAAGLRSDSVVLVCNGCSNVSYEFRGTGVQPGAATIQVTPSSENFGSVNIDTGEATRFFTVSNAGSAGTTVTGSVTPVSPYSCVGSCNYSVDSGGTPAQIQITFDPSNVGTFNQTLVFSGGGGQSVFITGEGISSATCSDGVVNQPSEQCDGADLDTETCQTVGPFTGGTLACTSACTFDTSGCTGGGGGPDGTIIIENDVAETNSTSVTLNLTCTACDQMRIANGSNPSGASPEGFASTRTWNLETGDGVKIVSVQFGDALSGDWSTIKSDTIVLNTGGGGVDTDGDGDPDVTDPDDDNDSYPDVDEIAAGSNPLDSNSIPGSACGCGSGEVCVSGSCTAGAGGGTGPGLPIGINLTFQPPIGASNFSELINGLIDFVFTVALIVAPILLIIAGIIFMTAFGDPGKVATARRMLLWTIIGFGIILISKGLVEVFQSIVGI
jgi:hypothetical protein